jgi:protein ImuB
MSPLSRRYLSVWLRRLPTDRIARRASAPDDAPLVVVEPVKLALRVSALNDAAAALGLTCGLPLADVRAMYPAIQVRDADRAADRQLLEAVADWCDRYTPLVGLHPPDGLLLDISGCAHLFGGEQVLGRDMIARLARQGLQVRLGLADTPGCAFAVARCGKTRLVPPGAQRDVLAPLPLSDLRIDADIVAALAQAGLKRIADIMARPRAPLAARYGAALLRQLDRALGLEGEPIMPRLPLPSYVAERSFPDPIGREEDVLGTLAQLAQELCQMMERRGEGARLLQMALYRADGKVHRLEAGAGQPLRDPQQMRRLFVERLAVVGDVCDPGFGYDMVRLSTLVAEPLSLVQSGLDAGDHRVELVHLIDRLSARFGARRLTRPLPRDTHIPERAIAAVPAQAVSDPVRSALMTRGDFTQHAYSQDSLAQDSLLQDSLAAVRPIRLFAMPERVEVINEVPDGAPVRFTWRKRVHHVRAAEGPERIAMEWWSDGLRALPRDYFRVESRDGLRAWLFRQDFHVVDEAGDETDETVSRWFVHGLFA